DMNDYKDVPNPFEGMDENYLKQIEYFTLLNVDECELEFISQFKIYDITIKDYSGSADLSEIPCSIDFDNYMGGDLSTVKCSEFSYNICFENYSGEYPLNGLPKNDVRYFDFENFADGVDFSFISEYPNAAYIRLEGGNTKDIDFNFIKDCKSLKSVSIKGKSIDAEAWAEILKNSGIGGLRAEVKDYSSDEADMLMKAAGSKSVSYQLDDSDWDYNYLPTDGLVFYTSFDIIPGYPGDKWECETGEASPYYSGRLWGHVSSLVCRFSNFDGNDKTARSVSIFNEDLTPMTFADGSTEHEIDFTVHANETSDFDINEEIFDFGGCEAGIYKVVFDFNGEKYEQMFFIEPHYSTTGLDFLTDEQNEIFQKAHEITDRYFGCSTYLPQEYADNHTAEEFLSNLYGGYTREYAYSKSLGTYIDKDGNLKATSGDRGGDISVQGEFFTPIYSDENEVIFKITVVNGHEDDPYHVWFTEKNFHMVKTDEGWRFDKFDLWY
ncbi:MAG: hypothetical protein K2J11_09025, partial [Oscillospiraceae bacterium]|nr:hypothetical protein [Oscillospiraceae bacterium]